MAAAHEDHHSWTSFESWLEDANVIMLLVRRRHTILPLAVHLYSFGINGRVVCSQLSSPLSFSYLAWPIIWTHKAPHSLVSHNFTTSRPDQIAPPSPSRPRQRVLDPHP